MCTISKEILKHWGLAIGVAISISIYMDSSLAATIALIKEAQIFFRLPDEWTQADEPIRLPTGQLMQRWRRSPVMTSEGPKQPGIIAFASPIPPDSSLTLATQNALANNAFGVRLGTDTQCVKCVQYKLLTPKEVVSVEAPDFPPGCEDINNQPGVRDCIAVNQIGLLMESSWAHTYFKETPAGKMKALHIHLLHNERLVDISFWYPAESARELEPEIAAISASIKPRKKVNHSLPYDPGLAVSRPGTIVSAFDEVAHLLPVEAALTAIEFADGQASLTGVTTANHHVSTFLNGLESASSATSVKLDEIKGIEFSNRRLTEFSLSYRLRLPSRTVENKYGVQPCDSWPSHLPSGSDLLEKNLMQINSLAHSTDISITRLKPGDSVQHATFMEHPTTIEFTSNHEALRGFLVGLTQFPGLVTVDRLSIHSQSAKKSLVVKAVITARGTLSAEPQTTISMPSCSQRAGSKTVDPFSTTRGSEFGKHIAPDPLRQREPLESYDLEAIRFINVLNPGFHGRTIDAFVAAGEKVRRVKVGAYMGKNDGLVIQITPEQLQVRELIPDGEGKLVERITSIPKTKVAGY